MKVLDGKPKFFCKKMIRCIGRIFWIVAGCFQCILLTFTEGDGRNVPNLQGAR